jgi:hypothetical protein
MRDKEPFQPQDLDELDDRLLSQALAVVPMREVAKGKTHPHIIGLRHDVDNVLPPAVAMAEWEADRGYRSTYFILHTSPYWQDKPTLIAGLDRIAEAGHEIGFHINAITAAIETGGDPIQIASEALEELRSYGHEVTGVAAHGDRACYKHRFVNDELFTECRRSDMGPASRDIGGIMLEPISLAWFGFEYETYRLPKADYLSDSGGQWSQPFDTVAAQFPYEGGQLHMLIHADWWGEAFDFSRAAA